MSEAFSGNTGFGSVLVYTVPAGYTLQLEMLRFIVGMDSTAGIHKVRVQFYDNRLGAATATLRDLNQGGANEFITYTYGLGLNASACVTVDGWEVTDALPFTTLAPQTDIYITPVDDNGITQGGDEVNPVTLYGTLDAIHGNSGNVLLDAGLLPVQAA